jgi:CheY-like chemotaxis protein
VKTAPFSDQYALGSLTVGNYMDQKQTILLVDDSEDDLSLMKHACQAAHFKPSVQTLSNGEEAITYLKGEGIYVDRAKFPLPTVMLLDLNMPRVSGFDVLAWVRTQPVLKRLSIIVFSASSRLEDVERAFDLGANSYLVKPSSVAALIAMMCSLRDWLEYNHFPPLHEAGKKGETSDMPPIVGLQTGDDNCRTTETRTPFSQEAATPHQ